MYERFTDRARKTMQLANQVAQKLNHECVGTEHILMGLVKEGTGIASNVLKNLNIEPSRINDEIALLTNPGPDMVTMGKLPQTSRSRAVINFAIEEAKKLNHNYVGTEHIFLGLLLEKEGIASIVLTKLGLSYEVAFDHVKTITRHSETKVDEDKSKSFVWMMSGLVHPPHDESYCGGALVHIMAFRCSCCSKIFYQQPDGSFTALESGK